MHSKIRLIVLDICMISPLMRHNFLLSSNTVFILSIHSVSIGPSNNTHLRSGVSVEANSRNVLATIPSVHCWQRNKMKQCMIDALIGLFTNLFKILWETKHYLTFLKANGAFFLRYKKKYNETKAQKYVMGSGKTRWISQNPKSSLWSHFEAIS